MTAPGVWTFARVFGAKPPLLGKGGVAAPLRKSGEASLAGADGVVRSSTDDWKLNEPPRPRQSKERDHLLDGASTPPLPSLCQGGEFGLTCCLRQLVGGETRNSRCMFRSIEKSSA